MCYQMQLLTGVPITSGNGRRRSGDEKRIISFLTDRINLRNVILKDKGESEPFAPWIALFKHRGKGGGKRIKGGERDRRESQWRN